MTSMFHRYHTRFQLAKKVNTHVDSQFVRESMERFDRSYSYMDQMRESIVLFQYLITHRTLLENNEFHIVIWEKLDTFEEFVIKEMRKVRNMPRQLYHAIQKRLDRMHCLLEVIWELRDIIRK